MNDAQDNPLGSVTGAPMIEDADTQTQRLRAQIEALEDQRRALDARLRADLTGAAVGADSVLSGAAPSFI